MRVERGRGERKGAKEERVGCLEGGVQSIAERREDGVKEIRRRRKEENKPDIGKERR